MFGNSHAGDYFGKSGNLVFKEGLIVTERYSNKVCMFWTLSLLLVICQRCVILCLP